jgi:hypothetical protein
MRARSIGLGPFRLADDELLPPPLANRDEIIDGSSRRGAKLVRLS